VGILLAVTLGCQRTRQKILRERSPWPGAALLGRGERERPFKRQAAGGGGEAGGRRCLIQEWGEGRERGRDGQSPVSLWLTVPGQDRGVLCKRKPVQEYWAAEIPGIKIKIESDKTQERLPGVTRSWALFLLFATTSHEYIESHVFILLPACNMVFFTPIFEITATVLTKCADLPLWPTSIPSMCRETNKRALTVINSAKRCLGRRSEVLVWSGFPLTSTRAGMVLE